MGSMAKTFILGNISRDPELKHIASGTALLELGVAVNERTKKDDTWSDRASFFECVAWGKTAETIAQYHKKGDLICLECTPVQDRWDDKETGKARSKVVFRIEKFTFAKAASGGSGGNSGQSQEQQQPAAQQTSGPVGEGDDIPF